MNKLVLFTLEFPFGTKETYLESEILYLASSFDKVYVMPSSGAELPKRSVPSNVIVLEDLCLLNTQFKPFKLLFFLAPLSSIFLYSLIFSHKRMSYVKYFKSMLHHFFNDFQKVETIKKAITKNELSQAIFYDYWLVNSSLSLIHLKKKKLIPFLVTRTHRFDLYDEKQTEGVVPFKQYKIKWIDRVFTISKDGQNYLLTHTPKKFEYKIINKYLGVFSRENIPIVQSEKVIVSCSSLIPMKQVDKIAEALRAVKTPFKWVHFGSGNDYSKIKALVDDFPSHIQVELNGFLSNEKLMGFYEDQYLSCFISLSSSEGLPVSMMEAQSFGIPIIAPPVNGIPEIVNSDTGILLSVNYDLNEVTEAVEAVLSEKKQFSRQKIRDFFQNHFDAEVNYSDFAKLLKSYLD